MGITAKYSLRTGEKYGEELIVKPLLVKGLEKFGCALTNFTAKIMQKIKISPFLLHFVNIAL
ncbi:MAG: hypothetical protein EOO06_14215 [Chitinophagaceae bacterium]|nr:MAG: hypothetical protein EOO06_14215 [Chitinophagaceae bacterium]